MASLDKLTKLKERVEELKSSVDQSKGALRQLHQELKEKHGCETLEEAELKLNRLRKKEKKAAQEFDAAVEDFEQKWGELLQEDK